MKTVLIMRHAKSSWDEAGVSDHQRKLNRRGLRDAPRMGRLLAELDVIPAWIGCSTARRAKETLGLVAGVWSAQPPIQYFDQLYLAPPSTYLELARGVPDDCPSVLLIGHNPGIEELVGQVTGQHCHIPTAAVVRMRSAVERWSGLAIETLRVQDIYRPKSLPDGPD